jgi:predicted outer membrane repeat protein
MLEALEDRCLPSQMTLTVTSPADDGSAGTLRVAIQTADKNPSDKFTIGFASDVTGVINLQRALPDLNNSIEIQGPGASSLTVEPAVGISLTAAIFTVDAGQTVSLSGLTIANGNYRGIFNDGGTLTVSDSSISGNSFFNGGGIANFGGLLTISDSSICGNTASDGGGGIWNGPGGTMTVSNSRLENNSAFGGGGIVNFATLTVSNSKLCGNSATESGGGIFSYGLLTVRNCTLSGNSATYGGGVYTVVSLTLINCTLSGNSATEGGGVYNFFFTLDVRGCNFCANTASDAGGGIYNAGTATIQESTLSGNTAGSAGGGIFNAASGTVAIDDSSVLNNTALLGADVFNLGALTLNDSTVGIIGP